jgi:hypothetical protein
MAKSRKILREEMKEKYVGILWELLKDDEELLRVGSNEIAFPIVDNEGNEDFIVLVVKIPTGANKGTEPYDGYAMAEDYQIKLKSKAEKAEKMAKAKAEKIARDTKRREKEKEIKAKRESGE